MRSEGPTWLPPTNAAARGRPAKPPSSRSASTRITPPLDQALAHSIVSWATITQAPRHLPEDLAKDDQRCPPGLLVRPRLSRYQARSGYGPGESAQGGGIRPRESGVHHTRAYPWPGCRFDTTWTKKKKNKKKNFSSAFGARRRLYNRARCSITSRMTVASATWRTAVHPTTLNDARQILVQLQSGDKAAER